MKSLIGVVGALAICLLTASVNAAIITYGSRAGFDAAFPGATFETWDDNSAGTTIVNGGALDGITYASSSGNAVVTSLFLTSSGANGLGTTPSQYFSPFDRMTFSFGTAISAFGVDINTFSAVNGAFQALTDLGDIALSVFDPFPGISTGQFLGFSSDTAFSSVTIYGGSSYTLDTLRFVSSVPEPGTFALLAIGLAILAMSGRRVTTADR